MEWQESYYNEHGCCLTCDPEWNERHLLDWDWEIYNDYPEGKKGTCLCKSCMCRQCYWYEPDDDDWNNGGHCTYPREKKRKRTTIEDMCRSCAFFHRINKFEYCICKDCNRLKYCKKIKP